MPRLGTSRRIRRWVTAPIAISVDAPRPANQLWGQQFKAESARLNERVAPLVESVAPKFVSVCDDKLVARRNRYTSKSVVSRIMQAIVPEVNLLSLDQLYQLESSFAT